MTTEQKQKLEAIIRNDIENLPYKYRELREMLLTGILPYTKMTIEEIEGTFSELELEITDQDKEWVNNTN